MPLTKCPDCGKEVSDQAPTCPNCGRPLKERELKVEGDGEGCFLQTLNAGCFITFVIIGIIIFVIILGGVAG